MAMIGHDAGMYGAVAEVAGCGLCRSMAAGLGRLGLLMGTSLGW